MDLNSEQQKAIAAEGVVIIIAGPGTGKTKTLTSRISYLIQQKSIPPEEILALTFTNKAAAEMKERLTSLSQLPYISTFHGLAFDILKACDISTEIVSERDRLDIIHNIFEEKLYKNISKKDIRDLSLQITTFKNKANQKEIPSIILKYNKALQEKGLMDYDDLLLRLYTLLKENNSAVIKYKNKFSYIHIDEFQDTNNLQYEIIKELMTTDNLFVIGDPYQSIYSFRGADSKIFDELRTDFPQHTEIVLKINYRSAEDIIQSSINLFEESIELIPANLEKGEVSIINTVNEFTEADWVTETINKRIGGTDLLKAGEVLGENDRKTVFSDFAVIYRTHGFNRILEQKFIESGIPYQVVGGDSTYEKPEVAFLINILRYTVRSSNEIIKDLLRSPVLGLSSKTTTRLSQTSFSSEESVLEILQKNKEEDIWSDKDMKILSTFIIDLNKVVIEAKNKKLMEVIHNLIKINCMRNYIDIKHPKYNNIHMFLSAVTQFSNLEDCVAYLDFIEQHEFYDPQVDKVTLLTIHAAKGLEFPYVFICGFEDGIIPFVKEGNISNVSEETRLLYVAMTRAKKGLYILHAKERNRKITKQSRFHTLIKSDFCTEKDDTAIEHHEKKNKKWKEKKSQLTLF